MLGAISLTAPGSAAHSGAEMGVELDAREERQKADLLSSL